MISEMDSYLEMKNTLDSVEEQIRQYRSALEHSFDKIDIEISLLNVKRREILLEILRDALKKFNGIDQESYYNIPLKQNKIGLIKVAGKK